MNPLSPKPTREQRRRGSAHTAHALSFVRWLLFCLLLPPLAPGHAQQAADPSQAPLTSIESIFGLVPASVNLRQGSGYNPVAVKQAEDVIVTQGTGRPAALSYKVEVVEPNKAYGFSYLVKSPITPFSARGVNLQCEIWGFFKEDQGAAVARVQKGSTVIVAGALDHCNIIMHDGKPLLRVDLASAKIYGSMSAATADLSKVVDTVKMGDPTSEQAHAETDEGAGTGVFNGRPFRHAYGGWFSYQVRVLPNQPTDLVLTYWGSDKTNRRFDILANGRKIGSQVLEDNHPDTFFDERYTIPADLTRARPGAPGQAPGTVTIRLQPAAPGATVGGVFGLRTEAAAH